MGLSVLAAFIVTVDPYDSGRFFALLPPGVADEAPRTANASRGRDPQFTSAIFGNSYSQLLDPARLSAATGLRFVQMTVPGTGPREQMALLNWFRRSHRRIDVVVLGVDETWCDTDPALPLLNPFPFWLYGDTPEFVAHHLSLRTLTLGARRIGMALGRTPRTDPAGYWDYESGRVWNYRPAPADNVLLDMSPRAGYGLAFPAADLLSREIGGLPAETRLVVQMPPQFRGALPPSGTEKFVRLTGCKHEIMQRVAMRPNSVVLDFLRDTPDTRDPENFMDGGHIRAPIARMIEQKIAAAVLVR